MGNITKMSMLVILWALSFIMMSSGHLPTWISTDANYSPIIFLTVNVLFAVAFIVYGVIGK